MIVKIENDSIPFMRRTLVPGDVPRLTWECTRPGCRGFSLMVRDHDAKRTARLHAAVKEHSKDCERREEKDRRA